jgi:DNA-binding NtrC family response regulator
MADAPRVLVVDDDQAMREMLVSMLSDQGFDVRPAATAGEALTAAATCHFDVVFSDIQMPEKNGFELLRDLRAVQPDTPVVLMTAFGVAATLSQAMEAGAFDCLIKPFGREELMAALERALER